MLTQEDSKTAFCATQQNKSALGLGTDHSIQTVDLSKPENSFLFEVEQDDLIFKKESKLPVDDQITDMTNQLN